MKRKIVTLLTIFLLIGVNIYAQGNLEVAGKLGVGTSPGNAKMNIDTTDQAFGFSVLSTRDYTGPFWGSSYFVFMDGTSGTYGSEAGGFTNSTIYRRQTSSDANSLVYAGANAALIGTAGGSGYTVDNMTGLLLQNGLHDAFNATMTLSNGYGIKSMGLMNIGAGGTLSVSDFRHIYLQDRGSQTGASALNVTNQTGLWIDKQALGGTNNYGIVLDGDGAGADVVFGDAGGSCRPSVYAVAGFVKAKNKNCIESPLSPHDPETGEWIFYSKNLKTGKTVRVNMEKLVKAVEKLTGETFMIESLHEVE